MGSRNQRMPVDGKDMGRYLMTTVASFIQDLLLDREGRAHLKDHCSDRLAAAAGDAGGRATAGAGASYSDQAVLANLDWGIDALEDSISTSNHDAKLARLDHAEKMLHVPAMLDPALSTAGVPNSYLSAWAHLYLSFLSSLRPPQPKDSSTSSANAAVGHVLDMFIVEPFFSRIDFAPELWESLFLPHMGSIAAWYADSRHRAVADAVPDSTDLSFAVDDPLFDESLVLSLRPDRADRVKELERMYAKSLDDNTRLFAKYYKDCIAYNPAGPATGGGRKSGPQMMMMPIAEPPMTPMREDSRSIPDFVRFGPVLPKTAGFSRVHGDKQEEESHASTDDSRLEATSSHEKPLNPPISWISQERKHGWEAKSIDLEGDDEDKGMAEVSTKNIISQKTRGMYQPVYSSVLPSLDSPGAHSLEASSPRPTTSSRKAPDQCDILSSSSKASRQPNEQPLFQESLSLLASVGSEESDRESVDGYNNFSISLINVKNNSPLRKSSTHLFDTSSYSGSEDEFSKKGVSSPLSVTSRTKPPKDFVCPITGQLFNDPVTLETGQTYERKAIQEWLERGNTSCPITRQPLSASVLPKTNYVLKRLINSWKEQNPNLALEFSCPETPNSFGDFSSDMSQLPTLHNSQTQIINNSETRNNRFMRAAVSTSPTSVISQAAIERVINELKPYATCLCTSEDLKECEAAVLTIARIWLDTKVNQGIHTYLSKPAIVNGFMEILSASVIRDVLVASIYVISELLFADESVAGILTTVDSDFDSLATLLKRGLVEASVLILQLKPSVSQIHSHNLVPILLQIIGSKDTNSDSFQLAMRPKDAAIYILEQILSCGDDKVRSLNALSVISANIFPDLITCLEQRESRPAVVSILLSCMRADRSCRNILTSRTVVAPTLELIHTGDDETKSTCISFVYELLSLNRRSLCNKILGELKTEGTFSIMHTLLMYLQMGSVEKHPEIASLLLQLDLLVEPRKMSIYREEAIESLMEAIGRKHFPVCQRSALDALLSLSGRSTASGKPLLETWLLKNAGVNQAYTVSGIINVQDEEQKAVDAWEKRVTFVLCHHENGSIFETLEECFRSNSLDIAKSCLIIAVWLTYILSRFSDTGIKTVARHHLLGQFINVILSCPNSHDKILACLAIKSFLGEKEALEEIALHAKLIIKPLKKLKRRSVVVEDILSVLINFPSVDATDFWSCNEVAKEDSSSSGEVSSLIYIKGRLFSSHFDGSIKVWEPRKQSLRFVLQVSGHSKAVTCLSYVPSADKLFSGSLDRTVRVWAIGKEVKCLRVHDMKEPIHSVAATANFVYVSSQGTGVKAYNCEGHANSISFNRNVRCIAATDDCLYCGCAGYTIQEVDLKSGASTTIFSGTKKFLGKQTLNAFYLENNVLFAGGSSIDGIAGKAFSLSTKMTVGSFNTGTDIHSIAVGGNFVFTGTKLGNIEVWLKSKLRRVASIKLGGEASTRVTSIAVDDYSGLLFAGTSDGKIQCWSLE